MATAAVTTTLVNGTANSATPVNGNFTDLVTFLNGSVVHRDGTKAFTGIVDHGSNKITGVGPGTLSTDAVNKGQLDASAIFVCTSGTRPGSPVEGAFIYETDTDLLYAWTGSAWIQMGATGAWVSHTPQIDQGVNFNIAKTVNYSKFSRVGRRITWNFKLTMTAAGATGVVVIYPPVAAASTHAWYGTGGIASASGAINYAGTWSSYNSSTAYVALITDGNASGWGSTPLLLLGSGDVIFGSITYEAAS